MTNTTLNLKASKLLYKALPDVECEKFWNTFFSHPILTHETPYEVLESEKAANGISAPSFSELLSLLPQLGEKLGWGDVGRVEKSLSDYWINKITREHAHKITDEYMQGGMSAVSRYVEELLSDKDV